MKKTAIVSALILISLLSGCANAAVSQPQSSDSEAYASSSAPQTEDESSTASEDSTAAEPGNPSESAVDEDGKFTAIGVVDSSAEEKYRDIASFTYNYGSEYKTLGKTAIDKMFGEALGDKIIEDEQTQKEVCELLEKCGVLETELSDAGSNIKDLPDISAVGKDDNDKWFVSSKQPTAFTSMNEFYELEKAVYSDITTFEQFEKDFDTFTYQDGIFCIKGISIGKCNDGGIYGQSFTSTSQRDCLYDYAKAYNDGDSVKMAYVVLNSQNPGESCYMIFSADLTKTDDGYRITRNVDWSNAYGKGGK